MEKKTVVIAIVFLMLIALVGVGAAFAFFSNEDDSSYLTIGANDKFSISIAVGETQGTLIPVKAVNDNTAQGAISDADGVRIGVPYVIGETEEGVSAMKVIVYASSAIWRDTQGNELADEIQSYMEGKIDFSFYESAQTPVYGWNNVSAVYTFDSPVAGSTGELILAIRFNVTDELLPDEIMGATLTVSVTSEFVRV